MMPDGNMLELVIPRVANATEEIFRKIPGMNTSIKNMEGAVVNVTQDVEEDFVIVWNAPAGEWIALFVVVALLICLDAYVNRKLTGGTKKHAAMVLAWITCGLAYNIGFAMRNGLKDGLQWFMGYALEWMLSIDNLFAFQLIVRMYGAPPEIQHKALFCGVVTSVLTRLALFWTIGTVLHSIHYVQCAFGFILIYAGIKALHDDDEGANPNDLFVIKILKACLGTRLKDSFDMEEHRLFVWDEEGRLCATLLVPVIFCVEVTDIIFAVDSVSAKVAQIPNQYIAYSSSVLALLGLRAMYFVIDDLVSAFAMLKYGVCFILVFIGAELMISGKYQLPDWIVCVVILTVFNVCIVFSLLQQLIQGSSMSSGQSCQANPQGDDGTGEDEIDDASASGLLGKDKAVIEEMRKKLQEKESQSSADESTSGGSSGTGQAPSSADSGAG
jgi:tellurite resistance protein TerC